MARLRTQCVIPAVPIVAQRDIIQSQLVTKSRARGRIDPEPRGCIIGCRIADRGQSPVDHTSQPTVPDDQVVSFQFAVQPDWLPSESRCAGGVPKMSGTSHVYFVGNDFDGTKRSHAQTLSGTPRLLLLAPARGAPLLLFK